MPPISSRPDYYSWNVPILKVQIDTLHHDGVKIFFDSVDPNEVLSRAVTACFRWLYTAETVTNDVKEITLILTAMDGVAYTTGSNTHKEIFLSLNYIAQHPQDRANEEITGVIVHEVVHCFQYFANGTAPLGLTEGIADYVRLKEGLAPPHWHKGTRQWDAGYDTTAYFLEWIEEVFGEGSIRKLNASLKENYQEEIFENIVGAPVTELWDNYRSFVSAKNFEPEVAQEGRVNALTKWPVPRLCFRVEDLDHEGFHIFLKAVNPREVMHRAVMASFNCLYTLKNVPDNVTEIVLVLRSMDGVAYTTGSASRKEIHFSLDYIKGSKERARDEITGVLVHEVVHCFQYNGDGACPGGLIEGIADFVRLRENLGPPHWRHSDTGPWDAGYERTAYFLDWIESSCGTGTVQQLNQRMKRSYHEGLIFELTGKSVKVLWENYCGFLQEKIKSP